MRVFIVEDDPTYRNSLVTIVGKDLDFKIVGISDSYADALFQIRHAKPDVVICDFHLNGELTGLDLGLKLNLEKIPVLLISEDGSESTYKNIVNKGILNFLVKPFHKFSLDSALKKLVGTKISTEDNEHIIINSGSVSSVINHDDVLWIESERNYTSIITAKKKFVVRSSFINLMNELEDLNLVRVHKRYAIPYKHIKNINYNKSIIDIGIKELPLGRTYIKNLRIKFGGGSKGTRIVTLLK